MLTAHVTRESGVVGAIGCTPAHLGKLRDYAEEVHDEIKEVEIVEVDDIPLCLLQKSGNETQTSAQLGESSYTALPTPQRARQRNYVPTNSR